MHSAFVPLNLPDLWQQEAVRHLRAGCDVVIDAPTGAGKTRVFELFYATPEATRLGQAVYTVPTRALANDKWREWSALGWNAGICTGDVAANLAAPVLVATLETQRERILTGDPPGLLVLDEYQMIADPRRGLNYELAMALPPPSTRLLLFSGSVANPTEISAWLERLGRRVRLIRVSHRPVPLEECAVEHLPRVASSVRGFWPRVASAAILAGLTPLLIFAPRRREAEKIAIQIASVLPPDLGIGIPREDLGLVGSDLARTLRHGVAFHHSGLSHAARARWVEPLGKAGRLQVIVATTGLAAGINFSVRSVAVASTTYGDGRFQRTLRPDELLQMFGRAGRRGLDDTGHVLTASGLPTLQDAAPRQLQRVNQIDWPTLLRVMEQPGLGSPLERAATVCARLFSRQSISPELAAASRTASTTRQAPTRLEIRGPDGSWAPLKPLPVVQTRIGDCLSWHKNRCLPALRCPAALELFLPGRPCRIDHDQGWIYGKELAVARLRNDRCEPLPWVCRMLGLGPRESFSCAEFEQAVLPLIETAWAPALARSTVAHGTSLAARLDFSGLEVEAVQCGGVAMWNPPKRRVDISCGIPAGFSPPPGSAARAWLELGLVDGDGTPTPRGRVFSRFQGGEGLMVAAALEDAHYPVDDLAQHIANLRGGPRFLPFADGPSAQLASAARAAYGHVDHEGYLDGGLSLDFGEGTAEALTLARQGGLRALGKEAEDIRRGDLERATMEWQSLLRHVLHATNPRVPRWEEFQAACRSLLNSL